MKKLFLLIIQILFVSNIFTQVPYVLVFNEDFNSDFNSGFYGGEAEYRVGQKWQRIGGGRFCSLPHSQNNALNYCKKENVYAENGVCKISVEHEPNTPALDPWYGGDDSQIYYFDYSAGFLCTRQTFKYGLFEVRARMPYNNSGFHSSIWLYGVPPNEIDITETMAPTPSSIRTDIHCPSGCSGDIKHSSIPNYQAGSFYTYQLLWQNNNTLKWQLNDQDVGISYSHAYNNRFSLYLDIEVDNNGQCCFFSPEQAGVPWEGNFPAYYEIDFVKIWKKAYTTTDYNFVNYTDAITTESCYVGRNITMGGPGGSAVITGHTDYNWWVEHQNLVLAASDKILLKEGFHAEENSYFHAFTYNPSGGSNVKLKSSNINAENTIGSVKIVDTTAIIAESITSTEIKDEINPDFSEFKVKPNPSSGMFLIEIPDNLLKGDLEIYDQTGRLIFSGQISSSEVQVDLSGKNKGLYFLIVKNERKLFKEKIVLE